MFTISTLPWLWLSILSATISVLAHDITYVTVTTTSTLVISVFNFVPTTHRTSTHPISTIAYSNTSIPALTVTPTATMNVRLSKERYQLSYSSTLNIQTATTMAAPVSTAAREKEDTEGDAHESHSHTTPPFRSEVPKPAWIIPSTTALLCFDFLAVTFFVWCWVMGWFSWWRGDQGRDHGMGRGRGQSYRTGEARGSGTRVLVNQNVEREMRMLGMV
ncbi:hypothetical protein COCC4DRAFT_61697 [Bipolaris maydis ATCC 48331]|uniref:Uncharacterized protein n=2 Tax=Cochliobolus heterostrophus TaxID=5016 RepID=M2VB75_COCH5|nr:uncharacterized protein COCC4DRAFT_61697 [Bipolaris maydis ATCC 48331]EMD97192.1 hypothetical protein COCHEDRAFT_1199960 [Bipolaris maydis C5]KAH7551440.1 hypothetical protein BM1_09756 [Bipolaris maydis]ENI04346.1 hypothetical protein COCC4DRAFT_61697 [Bipolaris maydis ATCC 48331]KAJ5029633.1 hypothetical protein J3E73DRAFT_421514 [Bipolaris maydis]KAJ5061612.1 hypothetical protein J3E74DRAFT_288924 [Bipolaris maydis]